MKTENLINQLGTVGTVGITIAQMSALYFDRDALIEPPYKLFQLNTKGHRFYYTHSEDGEVLMFPSVTTILAETLPASPWLISWIASKGEEAAERYKLERAAYGTFMHSQFEELLINRGYDLDGLRARLAEYIEREQLPSSFINYEYELKKDVLAFAQFVIDYDIKPYAVEVALVNKEDGYAGCIDLPCSMLAKKGGTERISAIVDFKSGRKGFFEEHEIQLGMYLKMWNLNFPYKPIDRIFNFSPKDWRSKPTYNLKDQTNSVNISKIPAILELAKIEEAKRKNTITVIGGRIDLSAGLAGNVCDIPFAELLSGTNIDTPENGKKKPSEATKSENGATPKGEEKEARTANENGLFDNLQDVGEN